MGKKITTNLELEEKIEIQVKIIRLEAVQQRESSREKNNFNRTAFLHLQHGDEDDSIQWQWREVS